MKINRENYELYMIDYFDGKLNAKEIADLMSFVDLNPDIKEEFEIFDNSPLQPESIGFETKQTLKKQPILSTGGIDETNYETFFIAYHEGDLNASQKNSVSAFVSSNPFLKKEFNLHGQLGLLADEQIVYQDKSGLKKNRRIAAYWWSGAAAAAIFILFGLFNVMKLEQVPTIERYASVSVLEKMTLDISLAGEQTIKIIPTEKTILRTSFPQNEIRPQAEITTVERYTFASLEKRDINFDLTSQTYYEPALPTSYSQDDFSEVYALANPAENSKKKGSLLGRIVKNYANRVGDEIPKSSSEEGKKDAGFLKVLDQSITVFNTITGSDTEMVKTYDEDGKLTKYSIEGETISWGKDYASRAE